jgi:hypothetical protein
MLIYLVSTLGDCEIDGGCKPPETEVSGFSRFSRCSENRASDVVAYGLGAGALVAGLGIFAFTTRKTGPAKKDKQL